MVQRMLLISLFVISNLLGAWKIPLEQAAADLARYFPYQDLRLTNPLQQPTNATITLADLGYSQDETLQGIIASRTYAVSWPDAWDQAGGNSFTVEFSHSPVLRDFSSLAVDWNGNRLGSVMLIQRNAERGSFTVTIPDESINPGFNQLRIIAYMGIHDDRCVDPENPAIWATIHSTSFFDLNYTEATPEADWSLYPAPIVDNSILIENSLLFVLPDEPTSAEVNAAAMISAKLGQLAAWRSLAVDTVQESALADMEEIQGDVMYVGEAGRLAFLRTNELPFLQNGDLVDDNGQPIQPGTGVVWMQTSEADPRTVEMVVTGADEAGLLVAAKGLANSDVFPRIQGPLGIIYSVPGLPAESPPFRQVLTFSELGYEDTTASGTRQQTLNFIVPLRMQWQVLTEATLNLHFAHSKLLHPEQSSLTVGVNGTPIGSVLLTNENADSGEATFIIPARMLIIGENRITVTTSIQLIDEYEDEEACDDEYLTEAWVVVYSDSQFNLPGGPASMTLDLSDYPFAFIGRPDLGDMAFVIPDNPGDEVTDGVVEIAGVLGRSAEGNLLYPMVLPASEVGEAGAGLYQTLIGLPSENPAIYDLNDILPLPFESGTDVPQASEQIAQIAAPGGSVGFVQAALAADGKPRLVATGTNHQGVTWAADALSVPELMGELEGDLAIMDSGETMLTATIHEPEAPVEAAAMEESQPTPTRWTIWLAGAIFGIAILILLIVIGSDLVNRRKVRKTYESPTL